MPAVDRQNDQNEEVRNERKGFSERHLAETIILRPSAGQHASFRSAGTSQQVASGSTDTAEAERRLLDAFARPTVRGSRVRSGRSSPHVSPRIPGSRARPGQDARSDCAQSPHEIVSRGSTLLVTRASRDAFEAVKLVVPEAVYHSDARIIAFRQAGRDAPGRGQILIVAAGTSDLPVAEEAARTAELMGNDVDRLYDVGVAGIHRLLSSGTASTRRASSSSSPAWKARCRAWSPASCRSR